MILIRLVAWLPPGLISRASGRYYEFCAAGQVQSASLIKTSEWNSSFKVQKPGYGMTLPRHRKML